MQTRIILSGTALAAVALCWALCGNTPAVDAVPTPAAESAVSAPCAPQTQQSEPSSNNIITEPVTQPETVEVTGSVASPTQSCPRETPVAIPEPQLTEETNKEPTTVVPESTSEEESIAEPPVEEPPVGMVYVPGFGYLKSEGPGEWSVSENMYENGNKVGIMG